MIPAKNSPSDSSTADESENNQLQPVLVSIAPRVLLVDDDEIMTERLRDLVSGAGYEVTTVTSGAAALAELDRQFAPILILDRKMPGMDGLALCRRIREGAHYPGYVYIMLCTAHDSEEEILAGLDAGADDYISKRASGAQLVARLAVARRILTLEHSLKLAIEERCRMAMTDSLTGAHNRRYFMSHMSRELKRVRRFGGELTLVVFDIDHFKQINDRFGHAGGDAVLGEFVRRVQGMLPREYDWCARLGGEEFAVVLPQTDFAGAALVAERIRAAVSAAPVATLYGAVTIAVSGGISGLAAFVDRSAVTVEQLLRRADDCLYESKHAGRNRVTVDQPADTVSKGP